MSSPQRPPRPDEDDLVRFHNGDTLDNIPVIRVPEREGARSKWGLAVVLVPAVALVAALAGVGLTVLLGHPGPDKAGAPAASTAPVTSHSSASPSPSPSQAEPTVTTQAAAVEQVRIIQAPQTGGDPSTTFCLVYNGATSGTAREAILLMNAAGYQCTDMLPYDPSGTGPFSTEAPECSPPQRLAVLSFVDSSSWGDGLFFTCLARNHGA